MANPPKYARILALLTAFYSASFGGSSARADAKPASASAPAEGAAAAFDRGVAAYQAGNFDAAAREFLAADDAQPSPTSLANALAASERAAHAQPAGWPLAANIAARAARREAPDEVRAKAQSVLSDAAPHVAKLELHCEDGETCELAVDDSPVPGLELYVLGGAHRVTRSGFDEPRSLDCAAGAVCAWAWPAADVVVAEPTPLPPVHEQPARDEPRAAWQKHVPIAVFGASAVAAVTFAGLTTWQGVSALHAKQRYSDNSADYSEKDTRRFAHRADYFLGATVLFTGAAVASALWWVDWKSYRNTSVAVLPRSGLFVAHRVQF